MFLIAATLMFVVPMDLPSAQKHEREFEPRLEQAAATETPKSIWRVEAAGSGTHLQSTMVCPASLGAFERTQLIPFDNYGLDVGCNFDSPSIGRITMYLTKRKGRDLKDDFNEAQSALKQVMPDAKPIAGAVPPPNANMTFTSALYLRDNGTRTGVWVADIAGWTFKFRASYRTEREKDVIEAMSQLTDQTRATAGAHLGACAAAPAVERTGTLITDADKIMSLSLVVGVLEASLDEGKEQGRKIAEHWCAEESAGDNEVPMLFWRNVANAGDAGPMDRLSLMTVGEPPLLISVANSAASLISGELENKQAPLIHQLVEKENDTTYVYAFYSGRPSAVTLTPLAKDAMLGKKNPVTSYNPKTNTITIPASQSKPGS